MTIRALTAEDRDVLAGFTCARLGEPWSEVVQDVIRTQLADQLRSGQVSAVGLFDHRDDLCGVAAWRVPAATPPILCRGDIVAVAVQKQRNGYGRALKETMIVKARAEGAAAIASIVHRQNVAMLRLNKRLGAVVDDIADDPEHCYCFISLTQKGISDP